MHSPTLAGESDDQFRTAVVIPARNEAEGIAEVVSRIACPGDWMAIVVDDGSTDATADLARGLSPVALIEHDQPLGYGAALTTGFRFAIDAGFDAVVSMDADLQHEPELVGELVAGLRQADIVTGSRWHPDSIGTTGAPAERLEMNRRMAELVYSVTGIELTDAMCGFRAYRRSALAALDLREPGYGLACEVWGRTAQLGLAVHEFPVALIYHDMDRTFPGPLRDPEARFAYYREVLTRAATRPSTSDAVPGEPLAVESRAANTMA